MPTIDGLVYPVIEDIGQQSKTLKFLFLGDLLPNQVTFLDNIEILRNYLADINSLLKIDILTVNNKRPYHTYDIQNIKIDSLNYPKVRAIGMEYDVDMIVDFSKLLICDETKAYNVEFGYIDNMQKLIVELEAFTAGNGIAWSALQPVWNDYWIRIFFSRPGIPKTGLDFMNTAINKKVYSNLQVEKIRHLSNRFSQIEYSRLMLKYYLQVKRKLRRHTQNKNIVSFEINYHLGNYYFLIAGAFDMLARLLNDVLRLGLVHHNELAVEKKKFLKELKATNNELHELLSEKLFAQWIIWLKARRNYIAHDASISITSIVKEPTSRMTDAELGKIVSDKMDWDYMYTFMPKDMVDAQKKMVAELIRFDELDVELEDAMLVRDRGSDKMFLPLNSIDYDFDNMAKVLSKAFKILRSTQ